MHTQTSLLILLFVALFILVSCTVTPAVQACLDADECIYAAEVYSLCVDHAISAYNSSFGYKVPASGPRNPIDIAATECFCSSFGTLGWASRLKTCVSCIAHTDPNYIAEASDVPSELSFFLANFCDPEGQGMGLGSFLEYVKAYTRPFPVWLPSLVTIDEPEPVVPLLPVNGWGKEKVENDEGSELKVRDIEVKSANKTTNGYNNNIIKSCTGKDDCLSAHNLWHVCIVSASPWSCVCGSNWTFHLPACVRCIETGAPTITPFISSYIPLDIKLLCAQKINIDTFIQKEHARVKNGNFPMLIPEVTLLVAAAGNVTHG